VAIVRLTPDLYWGIEPDEAREAARRAVAFRDPGGGRVEQFLATLSWGTPPPPD
jgi:hypothetical protein